MRSEETWPLRSKLSLVRGKAELFGPCLLQQCCDSAWLCHLLEGPNTVTNCCLPNIKPWISISSWKNSPAPRTQQAQALLGETPSHSLHPSRPEAGAVSLTAPLLLLWCSLLEPGDTSALNGGTVVPTGRAKPISFWPVVSSVPGLQ